MEQNNLIRPEMQVVATTDQPPYEPPRVLTYRGADILSMLGPAQACSYHSSVVVCGPSFGPPTFGLPTSAGQG
jgi:hypothetical protein